jgi:pyroglutamyl-peptidase
MSVRGIRKDIQQALANDGRVDAGELDRLALRARDGGKVDAAERAELTALRGNGAVDGARLAEHLDALAADAFVPGAVRGKVSQVEGRYAQVATDVPGLTARVGLFDSVLALEGKALAAGRLQVLLEGRTVTVPVARGESAAQALEKLRAQLPAGVSGRVFSGSVDAHVPSRFEGAAARRSESSAHLALYRPQSLALRPGERPLRLVVTGYGPFPGVDKNPSGELARQLAKAGLQGAKVEYRVLPVTHADVDAFVAELRARPPDLVISLGVSSEAQVEPRGQNWKASYPDAHGNAVEEGKISEGGGEDLPSGLPQDWMGNALRRSFGTAATVHTRTEAPDTSAYLCNYLNYRLLESFPRGGATMAGFVHVTRETTAEELSVLAGAAVAARLEQRRAELPPVG